MDTQMINTQMTPYDKHKKISETLRNLAMELNIPIVIAVQRNSKRDEQETSAFLAGVFIGILIGIAVLGCIVYVYTHS